jgi:hypothetical protein
LSILETRIKSSLKGSESAKVNVFFRCSSWTSFARLLWTRFPPQALEFPMPKHQENAQRARIRAEECRVLARLAGTEAGRQSYLKLANSYDLLAQEEEALGLVLPSQASFPPPDGDVPAQ